MYQTKPGPNRDITAQLSYGQAWKDATDEAQLTRYGGNQLRAVLYHSGVILDIRNRGRYMDFYVYVPQSFNGLTRGVLGNFNRNSREFFREGEMTKLPNGLSDQQLRTHFLTCKALIILFCQSVCAMVYCMVSASLWHFIGKVKREESLFVNPRRRKRQTTPEDDFVPIYFEDLDITDAHRMICGDNLQCLFDLAVTGNETIAMNTLEHDEEGNETIEALSMSMIE